METKEVYNCDYVMLVPGNNFSGEFLNSWSQSLIYMYENNFSFFYNVNYSPIVHGNRNNLLSTGFFKNLEKQPLFSWENTELFSNDLICKKVIFIDSDMVWTNEDLDKLIKSEHDITVAGYVMSNSRLVSVSENGYFYTPDDFNAKKEPFEVTGTGFGFAAVKFEVLQKMSFPWFDIKYEPYPYEHPDHIKNPIGMIGEDVYFCRQAKSLGYKVMCDPSIRVGHQKQKILMVDY